MGRLLGHDDLLRRSAFRAIGGGLLAIVCTTAAWCIAPGVALGATRFRLTGSGVLSPDAAVAALSTGQLPAMTGIPGAGGSSGNADHFTLAARLTAAPLSCASDRIFADGFEP